ncbi:MAG: DUF1542 domain-containing protein [Gemmataceae bacterium]|jgi:hypothetical protein|uniref:DUF1542 domain-containing protein n=1 Tax=Thermogemmata fonticola TaxID=2755323 RepID=A0A7V8VGT8_9BACT|nr:DUF1542 domain-containing protein [Thermogemmata fonticola]MBA2227672.1 DUF1542 domain-containing protein [Thermogemmata fonticola]MCX8140168.1 DUF1542 domain-containing protein [Gemmataceae bacterium]
MSSYPPDDYRSYPYGPPPLPNNYHQSYLAAKAAVRVPAFLLILTGILTLLTEILFLIALPLLPKAFNDAIANVQQDPNLTQDEKEELIELWTELKNSVEHPLTFPFTIVSILLCLLILIGGIQMWNLSGLALPVTASILAIIPCISGCCCWIGMPAGIWGLVVLSRPEVKAAIAGSR